MTGFSGRMRIEPQSPTIYLGFSGILHVGECLVDADGNVTLDSGRQPFEFAHYLSDALATYADVQLALITT